MRLCKPILVFVFLSLNLSAWSQVRTYHLATRDLTSDKCKAARTILFALENDRPKLYSHFIKGPDPATLRMLGEGSKSLKKHPFSKRLSPLYADQRTENKFLYSVFYALENEEEETFLLEITIQMGEHEFDLKADQVFVRFNPLPLSVRRCIDGAPPGPPAIGNLINSETFEVSRLRKGVRVSKLSDLETVAAIDRYQSYELSINLDTHDSIVFNSEKIWNARSMISLSITCYQGQHIPGAIGGLINLTSLTILSRKDAPVPEEIGRLTKLEYLDIFANQRVPLPLSIGKLTHLKELKIHTVYVQEIGDIFGQLDALKALKLTSDISKLPASIGRLTALEKLVIQSNSLQNLPVSIGQLKNLKSLTLNCRPLASLPVSIGNLERLEQLTLGRLEILTDFPASLAELKNLKKLSVFSMPLLPQPLAPLVHLENLEIREVDQLSSLGNYTGIRELEIRSSTAEALPANIGDLKALERMKMYDCVNIDQIPDDFRRCGHLKQLEIGKTSISEFPLVLTQLPGIERLVLSWNEITALPPEINKLGTLKYLDLWHNQIQTIPAAILQLKNIEKISFLSNRIETLPAEILNFREPSDLQLELRDNPLAGDEQIMAQAQKSTIKMRFK